MDRITIIIPFLNEGVEVLKTLESFYNYATTSIDVILINDASTDGFDYKNVAQIFHAVYIENKQRKGVAESREIGIKKCKTKYFLLLDAHMRAYQMGWDHYILNLVNKNENAIFCCRTKRILNDNTVVSDSHTGCGCILNLSDLSYRWLDFKDSKKEIIEIPCIMGASYICNKDYWNYLRGLSGLRSYGLDEQFISLKNFMFGGKCKLINQITFGHIFRELINVPYNIYEKDYIFNLLYIVEMLYPDNMKLPFFKSLRQKTTNKEIYNNAVNEITISEMSKSKLYYSSIFKKSLYDFVEFNNTFIKFVV